MNWYIKVIKNYAVFNGRARRKEHWWFVFINALIVALLREGGSNELAGIYQLAVLLPLIGVTIRRMHDVGRSGWMWLVPVVNIILTLVDGDIGDNRFGPDPKAGER